MAPAMASELPVDLLRPYPAEKMKAWKVGSAVGNVRNNEPGLVEPLQDAETERNGEKSAG